jgi:hypothetical protein
MEILISPPDWLLRIISIYNVKTFTLHQNGPINLLKRISERVLRVRNNNMLSSTGTYPEFFLGGQGADPEATYNLLLILKIVIKIML